jgi:alpha-galactosidase
VWYQFKQLARECFPRNWQHNRFWINDPDTVLLQNEKIKVVGPDGKEINTLGSISKEEFAFNAAYTVASGGMVLSGDDVSNLTKENIELLRRLLPPSKVAASFEYENYTVGRARVNENKEYVYIFNFEDECKDICVPLDGKTEVYDLIDDVELGTYEGEITFPSFKAHNAKVLACTKK